LKGWLVNDYLTCIPGTSTFWNNLLEWFPELVDKTGVDFPFLADSVERSARTEGCPDLVIRNASYFRPLNLTTRTVSLLQDIGSSDEQRAVCLGSDVVVANSSYTLSHYPYLTNHRVIPLGVDFGLFRPLSDTSSLREKWGIHGDTVLFIGSTNEIKGWAEVVELVTHSDYNFVLVLKDTDTVQIQSNNYRVVSRVGHEDLVEIINCCDVGVCTSVTETQHLAGIEMGACGLPMVTTNVGAYYNLESGDWGCRYGDIGSAIDWAMTADLNPRAYWQNAGMSLESCRKEWSEIVYG